MLFCHGFKNARHSDIYSHCKLASAFTMKEKNKSSAVAEIGDRFATIGGVEKWGGGCWAPFRG